jgi:hypothetical protein
MDKYSILLVKKDKIEDLTKVSIVEKEILQLTKLVNCDAQKHLIGLIEVNSKIWEIEDKIRWKEKQKEFDEEFINLARQVYILNDQRYAIKQMINQKYNSEIQEVKEYPN